tara:strand:+ start:56 stop:961 length:906 start_codon:yes stop_codon:yes gene_type:complete
MIRQIESLRSAFTAREAEVICPQFEQTLSVSELLELVPQFDGWIIGDDPATAEVFAAGAAGRLRAAMKWGAGTDNVDFKGAEAAGIPITNTPGTFGEPVSDVALGYLYTLARSLIQIDRGVRKGQWPKPTGMVLSGKAVALVGLGHIGRTIAQKLITLGFRVIAYDPFAPADAVSGADRAVWPQRLEEADFVLLACALTTDNRHLINADTLGRTKQGVFLINVGRGPLIDEAALADALEREQVAGAALEVMEVEPLPINSPLRNFEQVVFGSHNSSNALEAVIATSEVAIEQLFAYLADAP